MELLRYTVYSGKNSEFGKRPIMVFLHGLGGGNANWLYQFRELKEHYDLLMIELPSHARNNIRLSDMKLSFSAVSEKVLEVLDHLQVEKATFIGCSLGTMIVKYIVLTNPQRVEKYILIGPIGHFPLWFRSVLSWVIFCSPILPAYEAYVLLSKVLMPNDILKTGRELFVRCSKSVAKKELILWLRLLSRFEIIQWYYWYAMKDEPNGLYIVGELDHVFLPMLKHEFSHAHNVVVVKDAGHLCNIDQPQLVNELIMQFQCEQLENRSRLIV